jgi:glucose/mannose-6-phosphate isomerase
MDLDDLNRFNSLDSQDMNSQIFTLPQQLDDAWQKGMELPLPRIDGLEHIFISGMGTAALGADLLASYVAPTCLVPITVHRDYDLPAWVQGPKTLVIASSYSGNTEETLAALEQARAKNCRVLCMTTGGKLAQQARAGAIPLWQYDYAGQPRSAIGYAFGLLLAAVHRLGLHPDPTKELHNTLHAMRNQQTNLLPEVPVAFNPAKRMAGQLTGRVVSVFAAEPFTAVARRWKSQINEIAKTWGQFDLIPEANYNTVAGLNNPENALMQTMTLFLQGPANHARNALRLDLTREIFMTQGMNTDVIHARGETRLAQIWTLLHFGDYTSYYMAMMYGEDPAPVEVLTMLQNELGKVP